MRISKYLAAGILVVASALLHMEKNVCAFDSKLLHEVYSQRIQQLDRINVSYGFEVSFLPKSDEAKLDGMRVGTRFMMIPNGDIKGDSLFFRDGEHWRFETHVTSVLRGSNPLKGMTFVSSQSSDRFENYRIEQLDRNAIGAIEDSSILPDEYIDVALGLRLLKDPGWWTSEEFSELVQGGELLSESQVKIFIEGGHYVILDFDFHSGCSLVSYQGFSRNGLPFVLGNFTELKEFQGVYIPTIIEWQFFHPDGTTYRQYKYQIATVDFDAKEDFRIEWPVGSRVYDKRTGATISVKSRSQQLSNDKLIEIGKEYSEKFPNIEGGKRLNREPLDNESSGPKSNKILIWLNLVAVIIVLIVIIIWRKNQPRRLGETD